MFKRLLAVAVIIALMLPIPVAAGDVGSTTVKDGKIIKVGDKVNISSDIVATFNGKDKEGKEHWTARISLPTITGDDKPIDCSWRGDGTKWQSNNNLFDAYVSSNGTISVTYDSKIMEWQPSLSVGGKSVKSDIPFVRGYDPLNDNYFRNTIYWQYENGMVRNLRLIEGMIIEYWTIPNAPTGDIVIDNKFSKDIGFKWDSLKTAVDAKGKSIPLTDIGGVVTLKLADLKNVAYPITIDPTASFTASASDGSLFGSSSNAVKATAWDTVHDLASATAVQTNNILLYTQAQIDLTEGVYYAYATRAFLYFNTASLPDTCTITAADLNIYVDDIYCQDATDFGIQGGVSSTYPHDPLTAADFLYSRYTSDYGVIASAAIVDNAYNSINFTPAGIAAISKTGTTKLIIREDEHDIDDTQLSDNNVNTLVFFSYEKGTGYQPYLDVTYTSTSAPVGVSNSASNVGKTTARLNATLSDDGGGLTEVRWGYGTTSKAAGAFATYDTVTAYAGSYSSGDHPYLDVTGLTAGTPYFYRIQFKNDTGNLVSTDEITFTTAAGIDTPTEFRATPSSTDVSLTWTKGDGGSKSLIRYSVGTYPTTTAEGTLAYLDTGNSYTFEDVESGTTYYFSVWGEDNGSYSASYDTAMATVLLSSADTGIGDVSFVNRFFAAPDYTNLSNLVGVYGAVNSLADGLDMPRATFWFLGFIGLAVCAGVGLGFKTGNMMVAFVLVTIFLGIGYAVKIIPGWMPILLVILSVGVFYTTRESRA